MASQVKARSLGRTTLKVRSEEPEWRFVNGPVLVITCTWLVWFLVGTALFWGLALLQLWRARHSGDAIFVVAHGGVWALCGALVVIPPLLLTLAWYRSRVN